MYSDKQTTSNKLAFADYLTILQGNIWGCKEKTES